MTSTNSEPETFDGVELPIRVIVVDDHPVVRQGLCRMIESDAITVVGEAETGSQAVERARALDPDIVLMDVEMPDMDGITATRVLKKEASQVSVIIISGHHTRDDLRRALEAGACGYLPKVVSRETLIDTIRLVRSGGSIVHGELFRELLEDIRAGTCSHGGRQGSLDALSPRESDVLRLIARGLTNKEIGAQLNFSVGYVKNVVQRIIEKLQVSDRTQAAVMAVRQGLDA